MILSETVLRTGVGGKWFLGRQCPEAERRQPRREALCFCAPGASHQLLADSGVVGLRTEAGLGSFPHSLSGVLPGNMNPPGLQAAAASQSPGGWKDSWTAV